MDDISQLYISLVRWSEQVTYFLCTSVFPSVEESYFEDCLKFLSQGKKEKVYLKFDKLLRRMVAALNLSGLVGQEGPGMEVHTCS